MIVVSVFKRLLKLLPGSFRRKGGFTLLFLLINSVLDVLGLGAIIPLVIVLVEPDAVSQNSILSELNYYFGNLPESQFILILCLGLLMLLMVKNVLSILIIGYQSRFAYELQSYFSQNLFRSFYNRGLLYFKQKNSANILRNINGVPTSFATGIVIPMLGLITEIVVIALILIGLLFYNFKVVLIIALIVLPSFGVFYGYAKNKVKFFQEELYRLSPRLSKVTFEAIYGFTDVKVTGTEETFFEGHQEIQNEMVENSIKSTVFKAVPPKLLEFIMILGVCIIVVYGVYAFDDRAELITLLGMFALAAYRILPSVNRLIMAVMSLKAFQYTIEVMERSDAQLTPVFSSLKNERSFARFDKLNLDSLSFSYPQVNKPVLSNLHLELFRGDVLGIIGESGSGKSTLMNILLGFYPLEKPKMFRVNDLPLASDLIPSWQQLLGYVSQDVFMMDASIRDNVAFGIKEQAIDDVLVREALAKASLLDFVEGLEYGINSGVGERGAKLSGGQKQRLGIARALYSGAKVLFFDEATAALDTETEREITEAIQRLKKEQLTMVIVAHRITSLKYCDRILEINSGEIVAEHQYKNLVKKLM